MEFKKGDAVVQVMPAPIAGIVKSFSVDQETGAVQILVEWTDEEGTHSRYFAPTEIASA